MAEKKCEHKVVIVRTGENVANTKDRFCGWMDSPLSPKGQQEAISAGRYLQNAGIHFDMAHSSFLCRATETLNIVLEHIKQRRIIVHKHWRLNERHYGTLTGMKRYEASVKFGKNQVLEWQYSFKSVPPDMDKKHPYFTSIVEDIRYADGPSEAEMPLAESLETAFARFQPHWDTVIIPQLKMNKKVLLISHGDILRGLVKFLNRISDEEIENVGFLAGVPMVFDLDSDFNPAKPLYFLAEGSLDKAMVALQAKKKLISKQ